jgi:hypothetical protein
MMRRACTALLLIAALASGACNGSSTTTSPSTTTTTASTELFSGSLVPKGSLLYSFTVTTAGTVSVTLLSTTTSRVGPAGTALLSLGLGTPSGFGCAATASVDTTPGLSAQLSSASNPAGIYCVNVSDQGGLSGDVSFVIRIVHT